MAYKYQSPLERGYISIKLTKAEHNAIFKYRKRDFRGYSKYYYNGHNYIAEHFTHRWWVALMAIPGLIIGTLTDGAPSAWTDLKRAFYERRYGSFMADRGNFTPEKFPPMFKPFVEQWLKKN